MIKVLYLDEEQGWHSTVYEKLSGRFELEIPESLPHNVEDVWPIVGDSQIVIADYRLNGDGVLSYTGDDVAKVIHKHNKHLPVFIITSFEDNAIQECTETQIIRGKEMFTTPALLGKLCLMIEAAVNRYDNQKRDRETRIQKLLTKIKAGDTLTPIEEAERFDAELYLSELDMDSALRANLMTQGSFNEIKELISLAKKIVDNHQH
ncbi:MAG: hypothetical protein PUG76_05705 [Prevotellaceae bacterium]|nr:hypothetical protein [Prevotellaceae bacterium]